MPLLLGLGGWQLQRAEEKAKLVAQWQQVDTTKLLSAPVLSRFDRVKIRGQLDPMCWFLLDNRVRDGEVGYDVIGMFRPEGQQKLLLVVLGWVAAGDDRTLLPAIQLPEQELTLVGRLDQPQPGLQLAEDRWGSGWPKRIQQLDLQKISQHMARPFEPWVFRPDVELISGRPTPWQPVVVPPERHLGYAVQWFGLAIAWTILSIWFARTQRREVAEQGDSNE